MLTFRNWSIVSFLEEDAGLFLMHWTNLLSNEDSFLYAITLNLQLHKFILEKWNVLFKPANIHICFSDQQTTVF